MAGLSKPSGKSQTTQEYAEKAAEEETKRLNNEVPRSLHDWYKEKGVRHESMTNVVEHALRYYKNQVEEGKTELP